MASPIPGDVFRSELLDMLDETFANTHGYYLDRGKSLFQTLSDLSAAQASQPISPKGTTIAGHVEHMGFYLGVLTDGIERLPEEKVNWEGSWKTTQVDETEWQATVQRLRGSYQRTLDAITALEQWEGEDDVGASLAILAHTAAHLGAIHQALHLIR
jgi:hypothetical protein